MKIDFHRKSPFTSVSLIPETEEENYLTEEQTAEFKKVALRCIRISCFSICFAAFAFICEFVDLYDLFNASKAERILAIVGYVGLGCLILSLIFLFIEGNKLTRLSQ